MVGISSKQPILSHLPVCVVDFGVGSVSMSETALPSRPNRCPGTACISNKDG